MRNQLLPGALFQSTHPREGVRPTRLNSSRKVELFQSTHPREGVRRLA